MPICPVPPNRSRTRRPSISNWMLEKMPSFTRSVVGRVSIPSGSNSRRPRAVPVMTRIGQSSSLVFSGAA